MGRKRIRYTIADAIAWAADIRLAWDENKPTPAASFRVSVRQLVHRASEKGLNTDQDIAHLVKQICYRVSDLSCLLEMNGESLSDYCQALRKSPMRWMTNPWIRDSSECSFVNDRRSNECRWRE